MRITKADRVLVAQLFTIENLPPLDAKACVGKAEEVASQLRSRGWASEIAKIRYISTDRGHVEPRLFLRDLSQIRLREPSSDVERAKLAALLYAVGRLLETSADVLHRGKVSDFDISSKHQSTHARAFQQGIETALADATSSKYGSEQESPGATDGGGSSTAGGQTLALLDPSQRDHYDALGRAADTSRRISPRMLSQLCERKALSVRQVYELNERVLTPGGLAFEIEYGTIDFREHMEEIERLQQALKELRTQLAAQVPRES